MKARLLDLLFLVGFLSSSGYGLYRMKQATAVLSPGFFFGFFFYGLGFLAWVVLLRRLPLSVAFPIAAGGLIVVTQFIGSQFLHDNLSVTHWIGIALIIAGTVTVFLVK